MFDKLLVVYGVVRIPTVFFYITPNKEKILTRKTTFWYLVGDQYLKKNRPEVRSPKVIPRASLVTALSAFEYLCKAIQLFAFPPLFQRTSASICDVWKGISSISSGVI